MEDALVITAPRIRQIVTYPLLVDRLRGAYSQLSSFAVPPTTRHAIAASEGQSGSSPSLLLMPAWCTSPKCPYLLVKSVTVFPENGAKGLPAVTGTYVLSDSRTGKQLAVLDGTELILWRTACTSALAADYLARTNPKVMLMVGAGALAPHLIRAHLAIRPGLQTLLIYNRTHANAVKLAASLQAPSLRIEVVVDLEAAVRVSDLISCATLSCEALVRGAWLRPGAHLDLVGSFTPAMRECDEECVRRCGRVVVDSVHAVESSGELVKTAVTERIVGTEKQIVDSDEQVVGTDEQIVRTLAVDRQIVGTDEEIVDTDEEIVGTLAVDDDQIVGTLAELVSGRVMGRASEDEVTMFKSVGCTVGDLAAAQVVYEAAISGSS